MTVRVGSLNQLPGEHHPTPCEQIISDTGGERDRQTEEHVERHKDEHETQGDELLQHVRNRENYVQPIGQPFA